MKQEYTLDCERRLMTYYTRGSDGTMLRGQVKGSIVSLGQMIMDLITDPNNPKLSEVVVSIFFKDRDPVHINAIVKQRKGFTQGADAIMEFVGKNIHSLNLTPDEIADDTVTIVDTNTFLKLWEV